MRKPLSFFVVAMAVCLGLTLHARAGKGGGTPKNVPNFLARADFRDAIGDAIQSDGRFTFSCDGVSYDYIDDQDTCDLLNDVHTASFLGKDATYFLRPSPGDLSGAPRWLVLDFGTAGNPACPDLDTALSSYPGRYPGVTDPPVTSGCVDNVAIRFFANKAFQAGAQTASVYLLIDGPDQEVWGLQWNAKYRLEFVNPLSVASVGVDTITVATVSDDFRAQLWSLSKTGRKHTLIGIFQMPFQVTVKKTSQVFVP